MLESSNFIGVKGNRDMGGIGIEEWFVWGCLNFRFKIFGDIFRF